MKLGKEGRLDFNPKEWKKCATKGRLNSTSKKWMKFATKEDPRLTQKNEEVCWQTSEVRVFTQNVDEVCNRFSSPPSSLEKYKKIFI